MIVWMLNSAEVPKMPLISLEGKRLRAPWEPGFFLFKQGTTSQETTKISAKEVRVSMGLAK